MRGDTFVRHWKVLLKISASQGIRVKDLAEDIECSARKIYRDIEVLQRVGFPLYSEKDSEHPTRKVWRLMKSCDLSNINKVIEAKK